MEDTEKWMQVLVAEPELAYASDLSIAIAGRFVMNKADAGQPVEHVAVFVSEQGDPEHALLFPPGCFEIAAPLVPRYAYGGLCDPPESGSVALIFAVRDEVALG